ncbi:MAG TPA: ROK family protein [Candidatus Bathyarchaeota archaeon]|nr:ROK family protein [Candidatus Bathyarchaeota archaeon]
MNQKYSIGIDLGATKIRVALGTDDGKIVRSREEFTEKRFGPKGLINQTLRLIHDILRNVEIKEVCGVGIGSIGPIDVRKGVIIEAANLPFAPVPLVEPIKAEYNLPVYILNDCNTAVHGEKIFGAGKEVENIVYVTISTGIGGGAYVDNNLLIGKDGNAAEVGHMTIDYTGFMQCGCGKRGHWEAYCSGANIPRYTRRLYEGQDLSNSLLVKYGGIDLASLTAKGVFEAARKGDKYATNVVEKVGQLNAIGFANIVNVYDPSIITVGGSVALNNPTEILTPIRKYITNYAVNRIPEIILTPLGADVVLLGAIALPFYPPK